MHTALLGTDFRNASIELLEKISFDRDRVTSFLNRLPQDAPVKELVILSTCNRIELYYSCEDHLVADQWLKETLASFFQVDLLVLEPILYRANCEETVTHLYKVCSGVQSMVFGENEILGQVKDAYYFAKQLGTTGPYLNKLFQSAISVGKRVRDETKVGQGAYSVSSIAVDAMAEVYPDLRSKSVLVVGAGIMAERAIRKMALLEVESITVVNRTFSKAERLAQEYGVSVIPFAEFQQSVPNFDVVYLATSSKEPLLRECDFSGKLVKSTLLVDVGLPRNVSSDIESFPHIQLITIEALQEVANRTIENRKNKLSSVMAIIEKEFDNFHHWYDHRHSLSI
ncbi:glutamyl-tRNA reductase [bacterium]|jgi:glutamyl-tRNA reductase|nr:glutamyl-tRNA reductase [bacterium]